jgi:TPP-dependent indolepyruvate ferredoxin oxidoreductase alpha subunit
MKAMKTPNVEELAPEPDPNYVDPTQKVILQQQAAEMEHKKEELHVRQGELQVKKIKAAMEAAREQGKLGLASEEQTARIVKMYAETQAILMDVGISRGQALQEMQRLEQQFIEGNAEGGNANESTGPTPPQVPSSIPRVPGNMG